MQELRDSCKTNARSFRHCQYALHRQEFAHTKHRQGDASAPLRPNESAEKVGNAEAFLWSDLDSGVTGEMHVNFGCSMVGMT